MTLLDKYIIARWCYAIGENFIDDIEYRCIEERIKEEYPDCEYLQRSWSNDPCPVKLLKKYGMMEYYRDIKFAYESESIRSINSMSDYELQFASLSEPSRLSYKLDGFNIQVNYYNGGVISAETRGRSGNALNANIICDIVPQTIPIMGKVKVTGECVIPNKAWDQFKKEYSNVSQRNSVRTCMASELTEYLQFVAFNVQCEDEEVGDHYALLQKLGFTTPMCVTVSTFDQLQTGLKFMGIRKKVYPYPTDGLVIENSKYQLAIRVGEWQEHVMQSYVTGYTENVGLHSNPMLVSIAPVKAESGATYSTVGVTNLQYILDNDLRIGSPIAFDLRSMAAPVLNSFMTGELQKAWAGRYEEYRAGIDAERMKED